MRHLALCSCLLLLGCPRTTPGPTGEGRRVSVKSDPAADAALAAAMTKTENATKKAQVAALLEVRKQFPETGAGQMALYKAGVAAFDDGDFATARKTLSELVFENPLHEKALDARLKAGLAAYELKQFRDAQQMLEPLVEKLEGADKARAMEALKRAAATNQASKETLKLALRGLEDAQTPEARAQAESTLTEVLDGKAEFLTIAEAWHDMSTGHPAWPLLSFKLARVYYHLRDWAHLDEALRTLIEKAPDSPWAAEARALLERTSRRAAVNPKVIGAVLPMSGKYKSAAAAVVRGAQLALKGTDIELVVKDTQGDINLAGKMVEDLVFENGAMAVIGPLLSDDSRRAALVAEELQVPIITLTRAEGVTELGSFVFRNMLTNSQQADALAEYATSTLGYKTFAMLYPNISFGTELTNLFWDAVEKRGGVVRGVESYEHDQTTFTSEVKKLVGRYYLEDRSDYLEKVRALKEQDTDAFHKRKAMEKLRSGLEPVVDFEALLLPDSYDRVSLVAPALAVEDIVTNACDAKDLERIKKTTGRDDLKPVTLLGVSTWSSPMGRSGDLELIERGGKFVRCSVYVDGFFEGSARKATRKFVDTFHDVHKEAQPTLLDAVAYDTASMLKALLVKKKLQSRGELRDALAATKDFDGATGTTSFDDKREARKPLFFISIDPKGVKEISMKQKPGS